MRRPRHSDGHVAVVLKLVLVGGVTCCGAASPGIESKIVLDTLFMADIGHSRDHADMLTSPWPMEKCAFDGSFSLYEGLLDYMRKGAAVGDALPSAAFILGDVSYCGGDVSCLNATKATLAKYLDGKVTQVYPMIGNHDVHFYGCTFVETHIIEEPECHFGTALDFLRASKYEMSFDTWRNNWLQAFPATTSRSVVLPPPHDRPSAKSQWMAPLRYNIDLGSESKVYLIAGLVSGAYAKTWNGDTPPAAVEATNTDKKGPEMECQFLRDSLAEGRRLGKTIFIYLTHHFDEGCNDWRVLQEVDLWLYGHKHNAWQSLQHGGAEMKERRHYPVRFLLGNGGFDEGHIDVVSFVRMKEEHFRAQGGEGRVRLHFEMLDTCQAKEGTCPSSIIPPLASCWQQCEDVPGGYDGGGGPRSALPSSHGFGFTFEAPLTIGKVTAVEFPGSPQTLWKLQFALADAGKWLSTGACPQVFSSVCIIPTDDKEKATRFSFYNVTAMSTSTAGSKSFRARLAIWDERHAPIVAKEGEGSSQWLAQHDYRFYDAHDEGVGRMIPSDGYELTFASDGDTWTVKGVQWQMNAVAKQPSSEEGSSSKMGESSGEEAQEVGVEPNYGLKVVSVEEGIQVVFEQVSAPAPEALPVHLLDETGFNVMI